MRSKIEDERDDADMAVKWKEERNGAVAELTEIHLICSEMKEG